MSSLARLSRPLVRHARAALPLVLLGAAACADDTATAPHRAPAARPSADIAPFPIDSLWVNPVPIPGGQAATGTVILHAPAPPGGATVAISSSDRSVAWVSPDSLVVVPEGATTRSFTVQTTPVPYGIGITLSATYLGQTRTTNFTVAYAPPPSLTVTPSSLTFGAQALGTVSASQIVYVKNSGSVTLNLGAIGISGPFTQTNNCGASLAPGSSCTASVAYAPTAAGAQSGSLSIANNSPTNPAVVSLNGSGFVPVPGASILPTSLGFGTLYIGTTTSGRVVKVTSTGTAPLVVSSVDIGGANPWDFSVVSDGCTGVSVSPGGYCTVAVSFEPLRTGTRTATLSITHNAPGSPGTVALSGAGKAPPGGYIP